MNMRTMIGCGLAGATLSLLASGCSSERYSRVDHSSRQTYAARNPVYSDTYGYYAPSGTYTYSTADADRGLARQSDRQPLKIDNGTQNNFKHQGDPNSAERV